MMPGLRSLWYCALRGVLLLLVVPATPSSGVAASVPPDSHRQQQRGIDTRIASDLSCPRLRTRNAQPPYLCGGTSETPKSRRGARSAFKPEATILQGLGPATWSYEGDERRPARLRDCTRGARATINFNSGIYRDWQRFCYYGVGN